jgi:hypothetical protein
MTTTTTMTTTTNDNKNDNKSDELQRSRPTHPRHAREKRGDDIRHVFAR